jgi:5-methylcytosine-specific restriction endonuclease McrA
MDTLVLNSAYMPIDRIPWTDAIGDLLSGRAVVQAIYEDKTASVTPIVGDLPRTFELLRTDVLGVWKIPSIIRFVTDAVFFRRRVKFNRHNVWLRDKCRCQYCNVKLKLDEFTYDHVHPQSKGGETNWLNIVVACVDCNHHKANRTPEEARMKLRREPYKPMHLPGHTSPALSWKTGMPDCWKSFLASVSYWHGKLD